MVRVPGRTQNTEPEAPLTREHHRTLDSVRVYISGATRGGQLELCAAVKSAGLQTRLTIAVCDGRRVHQPIREMAKWKEAAIRHRGHALGAVNAKDHVRQTPVGDGPFAKVHATRQEEEAEVVVEGLNFACINQTRGLMHERTL